MVELNENSLWKIIIGVLHAHHWLQWNFMWRNVLTGKLIAIICITLCTFSLSTASQRLFRAIKLWNELRSVVDKNFNLHCALSNLCWKIQCFVTKKKRTVIVQSIFQWCFTSIWKLFFVIVSVYFVCFFLCVCVFLSESNSLILTIHNRTLANVNLLLCYRKNRCDTG